MPDTTDAQPSATSPIDKVHIDALMTIIHQLTGAGAARPTNLLDVRQRLVVQSLGLDGDQPIATIGSKLGLSASTMTGIIDRLELLGYVSRQSHPTDRRVTLVTLSRSGGKVFEQERSFYGTLLGAALSGLESEAAMSVLNALSTLAAVDQEGQPRGDET